MIKCVLYDSVFQEMNPFCLSANDMDMALLISRPGPPPLDVSCTVPARAMPGTSPKRL